MTGIQSLYKAMEQASPQARVEKISDPITLQSTVNGALVTVQRNSIAHAEMAKGENGMLVRIHNPQNRSRGVSPGVDFKDGVIVREGGSSTQKTTVIAPAAQAAIRRRQEASEATPNPFAQAPAEDKQTVAPE
jgi:hypothetical protein